MKIRDKFKEQTGKSVDEYMNYAKEHYPNSTGYAYIQWLEKQINKNDLSAVVIKGEAEQLYCPYCGWYKDYIVSTDINSGKTCKNHLCKGN